MNHEIVKQLEQAEQKSLLLTWSQVESLQKAAVELKQCLESVLRGQLLLNIRSILQQRGGVSWEGNTNNWRVEDGSIVAGWIERKQPHDEFLATRRAFGNFELRLQY